jgi:hypothetical protein
MQTKQDDEILSIKKIKKILTPEDISRNETTEGLWSFSCLVVGGEDESQGN